MFRGFDSRTLALVQHIKNAYLTDRATLETEFSTVTSIGASTHEWQILATNIPCRMITQGQSTNAARQIGSQEGLVETYRIVLKLDLITLAVNQRLTINGVVYEIVDILSHRTDQDEVQVTAKRDVR